MSLSTSETILLGSQRPRQPRRGRPSRRLPKTRRRALPAELLRSPRPLDKELESSSDIIFKQTLATMQSVVSCTSLQASSILTTHQQLIRFWNHCWYKLSNIFATPSSLLWRYSLDSSSVCLTFESMNQQLCSVF